MWGSFLRTISTADVEDSGSAFVTASADTPKEQKASASAAAEEAAAAAAAEKKKHLGAIQRLRETLRHSRTQSSLYLASSLPSQVMRGEGEGWGGEKETAKEEATVSETTPNLLSPVSSLHLRGTAAAAAGEEWVVETSKELSGEWSAAAAAEEGYGAEADVDGADATAETETAVAADTDDVTAAQATPAGQHSSRSRSSSKSSVFSRDGERDIVLCGKASPPRSPMQLRSRLFLLGRSRTIPTLRPQEQEAEQLQEVEQQLTDEALLQFQTQGTNAQAASRAAPAAGTAAATNEEALEVGAAAADEAQRQQEKQQRGVEALPDFLPFRVESTADMSDESRTPSVTTRGAAVAEAAAAATASADAAAATGSATLFDDCSVAEQSGKVDHVLLVIHGIGCGSQHELQQQEQLRHSIRCVNSLWYWRKPVSVHVLAINWKRCIVEAQEHLFQSIGISSLYEMRRLLTLTAGDLLFFMTPRFGDFIMQQVAAQLNAAHHRLKHHASGRFVNSKFSLLGYSLGSVMAYELLSGKTYRPTQHTSADEVPKLRFKVECLFLLGGCLPAFLLINSPEILKTGLKLPPQVQVYNLFHPCDPVAFRLEKLVYPYLKDVPPPVLLAYWRTNGLQDWYKWDLNVQHAKDVVANNLSNFTASVMSWWRRDGSPTTTGASLLAANAEAAVASQARRQLAQGDQQQNEEQQHQDSSVPVDNGSPSFSTRGSDGQLGDLQSFKSRLQSGPSRRRLQQLQATGIGNSLSCSDSSSRGSQEEDAFSHVTNWFRQGSKQQGQDATAARSRASAAVVAAEPPDSVTLVKETSGINRQLRKLTLQDKISRRPRVQTHQQQGLEEVQQASLNTMGSPGQTTYTLKTMVTGRRARQQKNNSSSFEYFTPDEAAAAVSAMCGETQRAVAQLEAVNTLKPDQYMQARIDFQLQEDTAEHYLSSLAVLNSHFNYFRLKDVAFFILKRLSGKNPLISYTDHLQLLEAAAKKAAEHAGKEGRPDEQQRQLDEAAALAERLKAFEVSLVRPRSKKATKT